MDMPTNQSAAEPSPARRRGALAVVPLLVAASAALLVAHVSFTGDTYQDCEYLGPSLRMYVTAFAAPACAAGALLFCAVLSRGMRARGSRLTTDVPGRIAAATACFAPVLILLGFVLLYWTFAPDPAGGADCAGLVLTAT